MNHKSVPLLNFLALLDEKFSTENLDTPHPLLIQTFSVPEYSETLKGSPTKLLGSVRPKTFDGKS